MLSQCSQPIDLGCIILLLFYSLFWCSLLILCYVSCWTAFSSRFCRVSNFNMTKTLTLFMLGYFRRCFHNPPYSDNAWTTSTRSLTCVFMWSKRMHAHVHGRPEYCSKDFCRVCTEFDSGKLQGQAHSLAQNGHQSIWCATLDRVQFRIRERTSRTQAQRHWLSSKLPMFRSTIAQIEMFKWSRK